MRKHIIHICTLFFTIGLLYSCNDAYIEEQQETNTTVGAETGIPLPEVLTFNLATDSTPDTRLAFTEGLSEGKTVMTSVWSQGDSFIVLETFLTNRFGKTLVYKLPGPIIIASASEIASNTPGAGLQLDGLIYILSILATFS